ncbi:MAG: prepilin-type N-terminal cleavage/methylation domain-containing protein [Candidatus Levybacteria bacterium]|nr:prepilin-type N-terminal cleavage/methylation domain-containing protein [Candidatus Levybacteria bacterium]
MQFQISNFKFQISKGFTLIELMIILTAITIISGVGITSFVSYNNLQTLNKASSELTTAFLVAKSRALSQVKPESCVGELQGHGIYIEGAQIYQSFAACSGGWYDIKTHLLPKGTAIQQEFWGKSFTFRVLTGNVEIPDMFDEYLIRIGAYLWTREIVIFKNGRILQTDDYSNIKK